MIDPEKFENVPFASLCGEHTLDAVDLSSEKMKTWCGIDEANCIRFRLDGKIYTGLEDPNDGYRSALEKLFVSEGEMKNVFPPVRVLARHRQSSGADDADILELVDVANGKVILAVGTDHTDDYYPWFVGVWTPQNMAQNEGKSAV